MTFFSTLSNEIYVSYRYFLVNKWCSLLPFWKKSIFHNLKYFNSRLPILPKFNPNLLSCKFPIGHHFWQTILTYSQRCTCSPEWLLNISTWISPTNACFLTTKIWCLLPLIQIFAAYTLFWNCYPMLTPSPFHADSLMWLFKSPLKHIS